MAIKPRERFYISPLLQMNVDINPDMLYIVYDLYNNSNKLLKPIKNIEITDTYQQDNNSLIVSDVYNFTINQKQKNDIKLFTIVPDEKVCLFIQPKNKSLKFTGKTIKEMISYNIIIGYLEDNDANLIKLLCISMGISEDAVNIRKIYQKDIFDDNNIDCVFIFNDLNNDLLYKALDTESNKFVFFNYADDVDINNVKFYLPYVKKKNIVISDYFKERKDLTLIYTTYCIDMVLYGNIKTEENIRLTDQLNSLNVLFDSFDIVNYYTMYFDFFKQTNEYINLENAHVAKRDSLPILEQFDNLPGFYNSKDKTLTVSTQSTLFKGETVTLSDQDREEENGDYIVKDSNTLQKIVTPVNEDLDKYVCYNNPLIMDPDSCDAGYWDKPCTRNEECPFYQKNTNQ
jgi:hypothetical protein